MPSIQNRLADLESLLELDYEKLAEHQRELSITASPNVRNEARQRIKRDIRPRIRTLEAEYWHLLKQVADECKISEAEAQNTITSIVEDIEILQKKSLPDEALLKIEEILNKVKEPETAATAKAKFVVNIIPGILAYEFELDTESTIRQVFRPLRQLFGTAAKK